MVVEAEEQEPGVYDAAIPPSATKAPGVWYRFQTSTPKGEALETPEYFIQTTSSRLWMVQWNWLPAHRWEQQ